MNWITNFVRPRFKSLMAGRLSDSPENLWRKCPACGEMIFHRDLDAALYVCPRCGHHMRIGAADRLRSFFDGGVYETLPAPDVASDPLRFRDSKRYTERLKEARAKTGLSEALVAARGTLDGLAVMAAVQPFDFMGGSLGMGVGEALVRAMMSAVDEKRPFVLFVSAGGARMQEGLLSLMQMPRVTIGVDLLKEAGLPYIVVLTDPTTGGVSASYAMLGDVHIAEPGALIGFAGQRVIEQTIRERLPEGFQRAEYLRDHGMVDMVVHRHDLRATLSRVIHILTKKPKPRPLHSPATISAEVSHAAVATTATR
ncbi:MAG: acetyl-CoA carboxylase, carboxyltransferase subunit beta [Rhizomicrobium sp.]